MRGFDESLRENFRKVQSTVSGMASSISDSLMTDEIDAFSKQNIQKQIITSGDFGTKSVPYLSNTETTPMFINIEGTVLMDKNQVGVLVAPTVKVENNRIEIMKNKVYRG